MLEEQEIINGIKITPVSQQLEWLVKGSISGLDVELVAATYFLVLASMND